MNEIPVAHWSDIPTVAIPDTVYLLYSAKLKEVVCCRVIRRVYGQYLILEGGKKVVIPNHFPSYEQADAKRLMMLEQYQQKVDRELREAPPFTPRERTTWTFHQQGMKPMKIAEELQVPRERVQQILRKINRKLKTQGIDPKDLKDLPPEDDSKTVVVPQELGQVDLQHLSRTTAEVLNDDRHPSTQSRL